MNKQRTVEEASIILEVDKETIRRWIRSGKLPAEMHSKKEGYRIEDEVLCDYMRRTGMTKDISILEYSDVSLDKNSLQKELNKLKRLRRRLNNTIQAIETLLTEG